MPFLVLLLMLGADAVPPPAGEIEGHVLDSQTRTGVAGATVILGCLQLEGEGDYRERKGVADERGRFRFSGLSAGRYLVYPQAPRYPHAPELAHVKVAANEVVQQVTALLEPEAVFSGTVTDRNGEPLADVPVEAQRRYREAGRVRLQRVGRAVTDSSGLWRIDGILRGHYYISAGRAGDVTWYPGAPRINAGLPIPAAPGQHIAGLDMRVRPISRATLEGRVEGLERTEGVRVRLSSDDPLEAEALQASVPLQNESSFRMDDLVPGPYTLRVVRTHWSDQGGTKVGRRSLLARTPVFVSADRSNSMLIALPPPCSVSASVMVEDGESVSPRSVSLDLLADDDAGAGLTLNLSATGTAQVACDPVRYALLLEAARNLYVERVTLNGQDAMRGMLDLSAGGPAKLDIVLRRDAGAVAGRAEKVPHGTAVAVPHGYTPGSPIRVQTGAISEERFEVAGLRPGVWHVVAVVGLQGWELQQDAVVEDLRQRGVEVTIPASGRVVANVPVLGEQAHRELLRYLGLE